MGEPRWAKCCSRSCAAEHGGKPCTEQCTELSFGHAIGVFILPVHNRVPHQSTYLRLRNAILSYSLASLLVRMLRHADPCAAQQLHRSTQHGQSSKRFALPEEGKGSKGAHRVPGIVGDTWLMHVCTPRCRTTDPFLLCRFLLLLVPDVGLQGPLVVPSRPSGRDQSIFPFDGKVSFARQANASQLGGCQNSGPFLGTLHIRCRIIMTQKGPQF